jgi:hypothetical protein
MVQAILLLLWSRLLEREDTLTLLRIVLPHLLAPSEEQVGDRQEITDIRVGNGLAHLLLKQIFLTRCLMLTLMLLIFLKIQFFLFIQIRLQKHSVRRT